MSSDQWLSLARRMVSRFGDLVQDEGVDRHGRAGSQDRFLRRPVAGFYSAVDSFGVPLVLRYVLQTCTTTAEAGEALARIPTHMSYNVTVLDKNRHCLTAMRAPDRPARITRAAGASNHQDRPA